LQSASSFVSEAIMNDDPTFPFPPSYLAWPFITLAAAGDLLAQQAGEIARVLSAADGLRRPHAGVPWSTPNHVRLGLPTMGLRDFSRTRGGMATLVCAPFALHGATITDLAPGHSLVEALARGGCDRLFVTDWRAATPDMRLLTIDSYLADLNVAVDELGPPVDLVGLCQGGWMALVYAARFPAKVRRLVLAGAPIDTDVGSSRITAAARSLPLAVFDELTRLGDGRMVGRRALDLWEPALQTGDALAALQIEPGGPPALLERFRAWSEATLDLPGAFFREVVLWLFKENRLAEGRFTALGRQIDLGEVRHPLFLLAAESDEVAPPGQVLATRGLVGSDPASIQTMIVPGNHLSLFFGARTLKGAWPRVGRWLAEPQADELVASTARAA
jgi:pimeloyl-ACP methyl ester carboxylesterase